MKVQIARRDMQMAEDDYRAVLLRVTGKTSSTACSDAELGRVLDEFKAKGWTGFSRGRGQKAPPSRPDAAQVPRSIPNRPADHPSAKKARALWLSLWNLGEVRDPSEAALEAFARRQLSPIERLQWADQGQTYKLIEALKAMAERAGWSQAATVPPSEQVFILKARLWIAQEARLRDPEWTSETDLADWLKRIIATVSEAELDERIAFNGRCIREHGMGSIG